MSHNKYLMLVMTVVQILPVIQSERIITTLKYSNKYRVKPMIVNGITAELGEIPYVVSLKGPQSDLGKLEKYWSNICGGAIYAVNRVLTAAHCFEEDDFKFAKYPQSLRVVAGALKTTLRHDDESITGIQWRQIKKVILHEDFHFPDNDIAIVVVDKNWIFTGAIRPARLASRRTELFRDCWTAGYGRVGYAEKDQASTELLVANVNTMPTWQCTEFWEVEMDKYICSDSTITDVSQGDSGSPLTCYTASARSPEAYMEGIVCGKNFDKTTLFTRVSSFHDWIVRNMAYKIQTYNKILVITAFLIYYMVVYL